MSDVTMLAGWDFTPDVLLFTTGGLKGVAYRGNMLFFIFYFPLCSHSFSLSRVKQEGSRQKARSIYTRRGSAYFVYPLFIVGSLPLFFCYVLPALGLLAAHRLPSLLFSFFLSLSLSSRPRPTWYIHMHVTDRVSFIELWLYVFSRATKTASAAARPE